MNMEDIKLKQKQKRQTQMLVIRTLQYMARTGEAVPTNMFPGTEDKKIFYKIITK